MQNNISVGVIARNLISDFNLKLGVDSDLVKKGQEPSKSERLYKIFKLYLGGFDVNEIVSFLKEDMVTQYNTIQKQLHTKDEIYQLEFDALLMAKEFTNVPDRLLIETIERSRPVIEDMIERYEKLRGWK